MGAGAATEAGADDERALDRAARFFRAALRGGGGEGEGGEGEG